MSEDGGFLSRWSRRKIEARRGEVPAEPAPPGPVERAEGVPPIEAAPAAEPLPAVESLTPESDFSPFMQREVDPGLRRQALKTLFADPRFNVMDGLDVYIDDYSKPDPLPEGWLEKMTQVARLGEYRPPAPVDPEAAASAPESASAVEDASQPPEAVVAPAAAERTGPESTAGKDA